jgi:hypothetical protein
VGPLAEETEYYWRIDPYNEFGTTHGCDWSFVTGRATTKTIHVSEITGSDNNSGLDWPNAVKSFRRGIELAQDWDIVLAADGWYTGPDNMDLDFQGKTLWVKSVTGPYKCTIYLNSMGRAFHFQSGEAYPTTLEGIDINAGYIGDGNGGGILCENMSCPTIRDCFFTYCTVERVAGADMCVGGGIAAQGSNPTIEDCTFLSCEADFGGGISCTDSSNPGISNCLLSGNYANDRGGGISVDFSNPFISDCYLAANEAPSGGAISFYSCTNIKVYTCWIEWNTGGGLFLNNAKGILVTDCLLDSNSSISDGAGINCNSGSDVTMTGCTIVRNDTQGRGGGLWCSSDSSAQLNNTIIWYNSALTTGAQIFGEGGAPIPLNFSSYRNNAFDIAASGFSPDAWCITTTPNFIDSYSDYHLKWQSPCIDSGGDAYVGTSSDLDGNPRRVDGDGDTVATPDMGCYEYQP